MGYDGLVGMWSCVGEVEAVGRLQVWTVDLQRAVKGIGFGHFGALEGADDTTQSQYSVDTLSMLVPALLWWRGRAKLSITASRLPHDESFDHLTAYC